MRVYRLDDTSIVAEAIGDAVVQEALSLLRPDTPADYRAWVEENARGLAEWLAEQARWHYAYHAEWRRKIRAPRGNLGRNRVYMFMRHWLASTLNYNLPRRGPIHGILRFLPDGYGWDLPEEGYRIRQRQPRASGSGGYVPVSSHGSW